jgi:hypothetical protein
VGDNPVAFGPGNGSFSPQEIVLTADGTGFLRNSGTLNGVYRFKDVDGSGRADDNTNEFYRWYTGVNAGFALEPDGARPGAMYYQQTATGGVDQVLRLQDLTADGDANDAQEATLVYSTAETGFGAIDYLCLPIGDLLITDNSGKRIIRLHDSTGDGLFTALGERSDFFQAAGTGVIDIRQVVLIPSPPTCGTSDFDGDGDAGTDADIEAFFSCLAGNCCPSCFEGGADFNADGDSGTDADIESFFRVLAGGPC